MKAAYHGKLGLQQRVLPSYRVPFFDMLAEACQGGLSVFAGQPRSAECIVTGVPLRAKYREAANAHILGGPLYLCHQRGLAPWLNEWDPDALILEANPRYLATDVAVRWMRSRGRPVLGWGLGAPPFTGVLSGLRLAQRRRFFDQFDALIAYSQRGALQYEASGFPRSRVFVATNSVSPRPARPPRHAAHAGPLNVLFVGRLQRRKRVDFLLRACAAMPQPRPALAIVGDGPERSQLEAFARQVYPAAEFAGAKHGEELEPYFERADLFVLPGTGGLAVQQAMAYGLPVIVAKGDGTQDDLVRAKNGWQIASEDYAALVDTMRFALSDPVRLKKMGRESFRIVSEEINLERMVEVFVQALSSLS